MQCSCGESIIYSRRKMTRWIRGNILKSPLSYSKCDLVQWISDASLQESEVAPETTAAINH